jgi:hypothetical protein
VRERRAGDPGQRSPRRVRALVTGLMRLMTARARCVGADLRPGCRAERAFAREVLRNRATSLLHGAEPLTSGLAGSQRAPPHRKGEVECTRGLCWC